MRVESETRINGCDRFMPNHTLYSNRRSQRVGSRGRVTWGHRFLRTHRGRSSKAAAVSQHPMRLRDSICRK